MVSGRAMCTDRVLSETLNIVSCASCVLLLAVQMRLQGEAFTKFPANAVNINTAFAMLFHAVILVGMVIDYRQIDEYETNATMRKVCEVQGAVLNFVVVSLLFGFAFITLLVYQVVVNSRPYASIKQYTFPNTLRVFFPVVLTLIPVSMGKMDPPNNDQDAPFIRACWLKSWYQFVFW